MSSGFAKRGNQAPAREELTLFTIHSGHIEFVGAVIDIPAERKAAEGTNPGAGRGAGANPRPHASTYCGIRTRVRERLYLNRIALSYLGLTLERKSGSRPGSICIRSSR